MLLDGDIYFNFIFMDELDLVISPPLNAEAIRGKIKNIISWPEPRKVLREDIKDGD